MAVWEDQVGEMSRIHSAELVKREKVIYKKKEGWKDEQVTLDPDCLAVLEPEVRLLEWLHSRIHDNFYSSPAWVCST